MSIRTSVNNVLNSNHLNFPAQKFTSNQQIAPSNQGKWMKRRKSTSVHKYLGNIQDEKEVSNI